MFMDELNYGEFLSDDKIPRYKRSKMARRTRK
jgi:hypothetical protein